MLPVSKSGHISPSGGNMQIGVMSDTHGNFDLMQKVADQMINEFKVEAIIHLGDDISDTEKLDTHGVKLYAVPGIYEEAWHNGKTPHRAIKEFGKVIFLLSHTPKREPCDRKGDINPERARSRFGVDVLLHGHTHCYGAIKPADEDLIIINPGHMKEEFNKNRPATYAIIDADDEKLTVKFMGIDGQMLEEHHFDVKHVRSEESVESGSFSFKI